MPSKPSLWLVRCLCSKDPLHLQASRNLTNYGTNSSEVSDAASCTVGWFHFKDSSCFQFPVPRNRKFVARFSKRGRKCMVAV